MNIIDQKLKDFLQKNKPDVPPKDAFEFKRIQARLKDHKPFVSFKWVTALSTLSIIAILFISLNIFNNGDISENAALENYLSQSLTSLYDDSINDSSNIEDDLASLYY